LKSTFLEKERLELVFFTYGQGTIKEMGQLLNNYILITKLMHWLLLIYL